MRTGPMRRRTRYSLLLAGAIILALVVAVLLRKAAPPEVARLLPESDAIFYANLRPLRLATHFDRTHIHPSPEYQQFIDATGIVPERDIDAIAFAVHRMADPNGPNGPVGYSEVIEGSFDGVRLGHYLASLATSKEDYDGHTIYTIPVGEGKDTRPFRITQLAYDTVAASNMPTTEQIHSIVDRHRAAASPFAGSSLLRARYRDVPLLSPVWAIGHIGLPFSERGSITVFGLQLPLAADTTFVASLRYVGAVHLRIVEYAPDTGTAAQTTQTLNTLLNLFRSIQQSQPTNPNDAALLRMTNSIQIEQDGTHAVLTANVPIELLKQLTASPPSPQP